MRGDRDLAEIQPVNSSAKYKQARTKRSLIIDQKHKHTTLLKSVQKHNHSNDESK